jgi:GT2 family glycosyltransferase
MGSDRAASIVIPVFNRVAYTRICLASLGGDDLGDSEIIVVDNGSTDGTAQFLRGWERRGERRRVVTMGGNAGFARGCNAGAATAARDFVVFLNNDTFVLPGWLSNLLAPFEDAEVMVAGSRLLYPTDRVQHAGLAFDERGPHHVFAGLVADHPAVTKQREYQAVTGASMAVRLTEFQRLGGFDESYVNSFEDVDLCLRVRRDGGRIVYAPDSVAYHFESVTEGRLGARDDANYELFRERWRGAFEADLRPLIAAAERSGWDLTDRVPPQAEALAALRSTERQLQESHDRVAALGAELAEARGRLSLRSVRAVLRARRLAGQLLPRGVRRRLSGRDSVPSD